MSSSKAESLAPDTKEESEEKAFSMEKALENNGVEDLEKKKKATVMDLSEVEKGTGGDSGVSVVSDTLKSKKEVKWCKALLGLRIAAFAFCLKAFSVMAADKQTALVKIKIPYYAYYVETPLTYRWYDYDEFKYSFTANVIGFLYSGLQIVDLVRYLITKKHIVDAKLRGYFNITMDQVLAYVLLSASSAAAAGAHIYESYGVVYGAHTFTVMAKASVALSFLAFVAFALASLVSGFTLSRFT